MKSIQLEICVTDLDSAITAYQAGAHRIELCAGIEEGGVTPSYSMIKTVINQINIPVHVLIRPRPGNFIYSEVEKKIMLEDIEIALQLGCAGIVTGALLDNINIDFDFIKQSRTMTTGKILTFHRAIDELSDPTDAINRLAFIKIDNILSSGGASTVWEGRNRLIKMKTQMTKSNLQLTLGGGLQIEKIAELIDIIEPTAVHTTARKDIQESGLFGRKKDISKDLIMQYLALLG